MTVRSTSGPDSLKEAIVHALQPYLAPKGFLYLPKWEQYRKPTPSGFQSVIVALAPYEDLSLLEVHLGIRQDSVENLAYPFTNGLMGFQDNNMTLVTPLAKLHGHAFQRFEVRQPADGARAAQEILDQLEKGGLRFLDKYSRLEEMCSLFNRHPKHPLPLVHNQINRCLRGLVLARLNHRSDFEELGAIYRERLQVLRAPEAAVQKFDRLRNYLRSYSVN